MNASPTVPSLSLSEILRQRFGLNDFRKGQLSVLETVVGRRDAMAVMPTGGGKSLCYQIPAIYFDGLVIVISPLIALMNDQVQALRKLGVHAGCLHSGLGVDERRQVFRDLRLHRSFVLYLSPERVQSPGFLDWIRDQQIALFAIDEAHCVSQWGPDFRPDYAKLNVLRVLKPGVPILALTATATPRVLTDIEKQLGLATPARHVYGFYRPNLFYQIEVCPTDAHKVEMLTVALRQTPVGRVLVYCGTRKACEDLAGTLSGEFDSVGYYHAGMTAEERREVQNKLQQNELRILVATNAFGMGVDYPDVRLVAHMQTPANIESLYQEMGRAGRDGAPSLCLLLYSKKDKGLHSFFINQSKAEPRVIQQRWRGLDAIVQFVESSECRHSGILTYFRDTERIEACGHCDICAPNSPLVVRAPERPVLVSKGPRKIKLKKNAPVAILDSQAEARAILLKDWRRRFAKERDVPAFIIFSDRTLVDLANRNPATLSELENVYGLGAAKIGLFGESLLAELAAQRCGPQFGSNGASPE